MRGPFKLRPLQVGMSVPCRIGGVYGLGKDPRQVRLVAYAERNLREAIKGYWNEYEFFWFQPCLSPRECYVQVCQHYHECIENGGLDVEEHPTAPAGVKEKCPVCGK